MARPTDDLILRHFGLRENPFGVTPDPRFLFLTHTHREALASLVNGIECGFGFQVLVAQPGMGKTTLLFDLLERFRSSRTAFLFQQQHDSREFLQSLLLELQSESVETSHAKLYSQLNQLLSNAALTRERVIVVVDEAQNLEDSLLETLRQLSNFETTRLKLLQIVLAGQPQLAKRLARPEQEQLRQRISTIARLSPLGLNETLTYLNHRLNVAGYRGAELFTEGARQAIWSRGQGIPRNMNTLCFNAMLLAFAQSAKRIDERAVQEAAQDLDLDYVLADLTSIREPSVEVAEHSLATRLVLSPKSDHNGRPVGAVASLNIDPHPSVTESSVGPTPVQVRKANLSSIAAPAEQKTVLKPQPAGAPLSLANNHRPSVAESLSRSAPVTTANPRLTASVVPGASKAGHNQQAAVNPASADNNPRPSPAESSPGSRTHSRRNFVMALLVIAGIAAGVLFGQGLGSRRQRRIEEALQSLLRLQQPQEPPVLDAPLTPSRSDRESTALAIDNSPEVVTRTFQRTGDELPEVITRTFQPAVPNGAGSAALRNVKAVFFDVDSAFVSGKYDTTLQRVAEILSENSESTAIIEGHTDNSGVESYNSQLSNRRALAVKDVLVNQYHISSGRLNTVGAGSSAPIESNSTGSGRAYNRRVEIRISRPNG